MDRNVPEMRTGMSWPLVGRHEELAFCASCLQSGSGVKGLVVAGAPGVGKTRLITEALAGAEGAGRVTARATATAAARTIPLGALSHLLPAEPSQATSTLELLREARAALVARSGADPLVLCVDDAHLLDPASATLVQQLVLGGGAVVAATLRSGEVAPDAVVALWKDHGCAYLELQPLSRAETGELLALFLEGPVEGRAERALWELSRGTPMFLRELVLDGLERGVLDELDGLWCWHGELKTSHRLRDLVHSRIGTVDDAELDVLEVVAVGEPVPMSWLPDDDAIHALLRSDVLVSQLDRGRAELRFAHPIYGEVVRADMDVARVQKVSRRLADRLEEDGVDRGGDLLRLASWRLEAGGEASATVFTESARLAELAGSSVLAERLAAAAELRDGGFDATYILTRALIGQGRLEEATDALLELQAGAATDAQRAAVAETLARALAGGLQRAEDAVTVVRGAREVVTDPTLQAQLALTEAWITFRLGGPSEAAAVVAGIVDDPAVAEEVRAPAAASCAQWLAQAGRSKSGIRLAENWLNASHPSHSGSHARRPDLRFAYGITLMTAGRLQDAERVAEMLYADAIESADAELLGLATFLRAAVAMTRGCITPALNWTHEGVHLMREIDPRGMLPWMLGLLAQTSGMAGEAATAARAAEEATLLGAGTWIYSAPVELGHTWSYAAAGSMSKARESALRAATICIDHGQLATATWALHDLARLGDPGNAAPRLEALAERVEGPLVRACADHAKALVLRDTGALRHVAEAFEAMGATLYACEAWSEAAALYTNDGRSASARTCAARSGVLREMCPGARTPGLSGAEGFDALTRREREIVTLAARGATNRDIAAELVISVRTVENQLQRAYRKLGVSRRGDLARLFEVGRTG